MVTVRTLSLGAVVTYVGSIMGVGWLVALGVFTIIVGVALPILQFLNDRGLLKRRRR